MKMLKMRWSRKISLSTTTLLIFINCYVTSNALSQTNDTILESKSITPLNYEYFEHSNKGCKENSWCDEAMGTHYSEWNHFIHKINNDGLSEEKKIALLEERRKQSGIPIEFYASEDAMKNYGPLLWDSPCKTHTGKKIYLGIAFMTEAKNQIAEIKKGQQTLNIKLGEQLQLDPIHVYQDKKIQTYFVPRGEVPVYLGTDSVTLLREEEGWYYLLEIFQQGAWKIKTNDKEKTEKAVKAYEEVKCPDETKIESRYYHSYFCKKVWNQATQNTVTIKFPWSC
ncbi:MAG: hypothetical protein JNM93_05650 [Bacteriovoracaceae bacterium]|nr:hypothetical protein [Bacteriovoracaceae bacterium]